MNRPIAAAVAAGAAAVLLAALYQPPAGHAGPYAAIAGADPAFEPRMVRPALEPPDLAGILGYGGHPYGYSAARLPGDGSVVLTFEDPAGTGRTHSQRYEPGQTFAYSCPDYFGRMHMFQYLGAAEGPGGRVLEMVQFEVDAPGAPCEFPGYLERTVDIFDAGRLGEPADGGRGGAGYAGLVAGATIATPIFVDPYPATPPEGKPYGHPGDVRPLPDGSISVTFSDGGDPPREYAAAYAPGQTFAALCREAGDATLLHMYNYRGTEEFGGSEYMMLVGFWAYTPGPAPCGFPGFIEESVDAFDMGWYDGRYEEELGAMMPVLGGRAGP